ncbi:MAG: DUF5666 domain-containing protein [Candidatus Zixiibacteriota bacterium]
MKAKMILLGVLPLIALVTVVGCNRQAPMDPLMTTSADGGLFYTQAAAPGPVQFSARVETTDQNRLMLTFVGNPDTVFALHNCQIVRLKGSTEAPIPFTDIQPGDSMGVVGTRNQDGYVYATKLQLCQSAAGLGYDLAFRDTIATIDYAAGTFTVKNHTQSILVDENTVIWGVITKQQFGPMDPTIDPNGPNGDCNNSAGKPNPDGPGGFQVSHDTSLVFSDLQVGDVVEVRANIVDEATLLAGKIKLINCPEKLCVTFEAYLASVDVTARVVTFDALPWIGTVCQGAKLTGLDGEPLTLADFATGEFVSVKGFPLAGDTLKVCQMEKTVTP